MKRFLLLLLLPLSLAGQTIEYETHKSFQIDSIIFRTYNLKIDNHSASDPAMIFVVPDKYFDSAITHIKKIYFSRKQEYTEYYILGIDHSSQTETTKKALVEFLTQIDRSRIIRNRSTFLKKYSCENNKIFYHSTTKDLSEVDNLYYLKSTKDLCKFMVCSPNYNQRFIP